MTDLIPEYLAMAYCGRTNGTVTRTEYFLRALAEFTGYQQIDDRWYAAWRAAALKRWKPGTARLALVQTDRFIRWMGMRGYILPSPDFKFSKPLLPPLPPKPTPLITQDEYLALKDVTVGNPPLQFAIILGWATGMRLSDVCLLTWDCVNWETMEIEVMPLKTRRFRARAFIPIQVGSHLYVALEAKRKVPPLETWPNNPGEGIYYVEPELAVLYKRQQANHSQGLQRLFRDACAKAGVKGKTFHGFRVAFCSMLANGNVNSALACSMTGHLDPKVFKQYVRVDRQALREAMWKVRGFGAQQG